jgi:putative membrane protein
MTDGTILGEKIPLNATPFTLCGVALTIFLAFRNNASYQRYLEARHLWGETLNASRSLTSQVVSYLPENTAGFDRVNFVQGVIGFVYALKHQLRGTDATADLIARIGAQRAAVCQRAHYRPVRMLGDIRLTLARLHRRALISDTQLWMFDAQINELEKAVGGCERITSTPIPFAYGVLLHRTVYAYCLLLPFGLVDSIGFFTPLVSVFVSYTLIALEAIAAEIAEPFGTAPNCLPLNAMTRTIERSLLELCGEAVPAEEKPVDAYQLT